MTEKGKTRLDLIKNFKQLFEGKEKYLKEEGEEIPKEERQGFIDRTSVMLIIPKKKWVLKAINELFDVSKGTTEPIKTLDYKASNNKGLEVAGNYSCEYLKMVLELCKNYEYIKIKMLSDYPLYIETIDFDLILAPRVVSE